MSETKQIAQGPFAGYYAGDRVVICDKWGSVKATIVGWSSKLENHVALKFDVEVFGNSDGQISLSDLAHRAYGEVVLPTTSKE